MTKKLVNFRVDSDLWENYQTYCKSIDISASESIVNHINDVLNSCKDECKDECKDNVSNEDIDIVVSQVKEAVLSNEDFRLKIEHLAMEAVNIEVDLHRDVEEISYELLNGKINEISLQLENLDAKLEHIEDNRIDKIQEKLNRVYTDFYGVLEYAKRQGYEGPPTTKRIKPKGFKTI
jgi:molecular chaperone GrpE (heat shock protein)